MFLSGSPIGLEELPGGPRDTTTAIADAPLSLLPFLYDAFPSMLGLCFADSGSPVPGPIGLIAFVMFYLSPLDSATGTVTGWLPLSIRVLCVVSLVLYLGEVVQGSLRGYVGDGEDILTPQLFDCAVLLLARYVTPSTRGGLVGPLYATGTAFIPRDAHPFHRIHRPVIGIMSS